MKKNAHTFGRDRNWIIMKEKSHESSNKITSLSIIQGKDQTTKRKEDEAIYFMAIDQLSLVNQRLPKLILDWDKYCGVFLTRAQIIIYINRPRFVLWSTQLNMILPNSIQMKRKEKRKNLSVGIQVEAVSRYKSELHITHDKVSNVCSTKISSKLLKTPIETQREWIRNCIGDLNQDKNFCVN